MTSFFRTPVDAASGSTSAARPGSVSSSPAEPVLIAHRGLGSGFDGELVENTPASVAEAARLGYPWVEIDVRRTIDDGLVLVHHPTLPDGRFVADVTVAEARAAGVSTLAEGLAALPPGVGVDLDLKSSLEDATLPAGRTTAALLAAFLTGRAGPESARPTIVTSFDPGALTQLRSSAPDVPLGLLTWKHFPLRKAIPAAVHLGVEVVAAHVPSFAASSVDPAPLHRSAAHSVSVAHEAGLAVVAWCPRAEEAEALAAAGVDAFVVNHRDFVRPTEPEPSP